MIKKLEKIYFSKLRIRQDASESVFYFAAEDFPGLNRSSFDFVAEQGHILKGWFYRYENPNPDRIVIFEHGMGCGHRAYFREIERLARAGYTVYAYDHTGCAESEGESTRGFSQSLSDLNACIKALKENPECAGKRLSLIGHSWGGYSSLNISEFHPDLAHIVSLSGFVSVSQMVKQSIGGPLIFFRKHFLNLEREVNPALFDLSAEKSLGKAQGKVLVIHSLDDHVVKAKHHFLWLKKRLTAKAENVTFLTLTGKKHNPNYTEDALTYKDAFFAELVAKTKRGELATSEQKKAFRESFDWYRMTEQDETVWQTVLEFLES
jgi:pimeloyl-ACP methyl ester carboxylesterase